MRYARNNDAHFVMRNNSMFNPNNDSGLELVIGSDGLVYDIVPSVSSGAGLPLSDNIDYGHDYSQPQPAYSTGNADGTHRRARALRPAGQDQPVQDATRSSSSRAARTPTSSGTPSSTRCGSRTAWSRRGGAAPGTADAGTRHVHPVAPALPGHLFGAVPAADRRLTSARPHRSHR